MSHGIGTGPRSPGAARYLGKDLQGADLQDAELGGADLRGADLRGAALGGADLRGADLRGADLRGAKLQEDAECAADLRGADLRGANLRGANLRGAKLPGTKLQGAKLQGANLEDTDLSSADLSNASLFNAKLRNAYLTFANLANADLAHADLQDADLHGANLEVANLRGAKLYDLDLGPIADTPSCLVGSNGIGISAVARSLKCPGLHDFLVRCGQPVVVATYLIDSLRSLDIVELFKMIQTVFISYGGPDTAFSNKLRDALETSGCKTWQFARDAVPGDKLHWIMHSRLREHDRTVLICSKKSLTRPGVLNEIEEALTFEAEQGGAGVIIPITLDGYVFSDTFKVDLEKAVGPQRAGIVARLLIRVVGDFQGALDDDDKFNEGLRKLLLALRPVP